MTSQQTAVRITRTIAAPPQKVYRAWLDPELLRRWLAPASLAVAAVEVEERLGGHHRTWQVGPDGEDVGGFDATIVELVPGERIVFEWRFVGPDRVADPSHDSRLTISLSAAPGGATELNLVHERLDALHEAMPEVADNVGRGWEMALDKLAVLVAEWKKTHCYS
ncbi:MAG: SRPBCC family protein [Solirubrobacterales bacterium]